MLKLRVIGIQRFKFAFISVHSRPFPSIRG